MTAPDKPGLSNEAFIEKWRKYLKGDREDTGEQIIYNLRVLPEALDRLEALIGQGKPTPGQIGHELRPEDGPFKVEVDDHSDDCGTVYRLFGPSTSILHKDKDYLDEMAEHHNWGWYQAILSVSGQGQEERDFNFKDALDSALFELLDKCRENCNHGCHTVDDDTAWDECPDHKFMTDEIDKLRKTNWPEVQERLSGGGDERWVLDELKSIVKDLAETDRPEPTKENMWFRNLRVRASKLMPSLESQASGKVKPNE